MVSRERLHVFFTPTKIDRVMCPRTVVNKETSVSTTVGEDVVDRDFELLVPSSRSRIASKRLIQHLLADMVMALVSIVSQREELGPFFVPMLRIGIIQLELVLLWLRDVYLHKAQVSFELSFSASAWSRPKTNATSPGFADKGPHPPDSQEQCQDKAAREGDRQAERVPCGRKSPNLNTGNSRS